jgi:hypothetical protein
MRITSLTPILIVDAIEPLLPFWFEAGLQQLMEVEEPNGLGFVGLGQDGAVTLMLQTKASLSADLPAVAATHPATLLYADTDDLAAIEAATAHDDLLVPHRTTFYGADEIWVRAANGTIVGYAQSSAATPGEG